MAWHILFPEVLQFVLTAAASDHKQNWCVLSRIGFRSKYKNQVSENTDLLNQIQLKYTTI